jgi:RNA polymerase sigma factor (sigma-70 family)
MATARKSAAGIAHAAITAVSLGAIVRQVVNQLMPPGSYSITKVTGLSREDLSDIATALAESIAETWDPERGARPETWIRTMLHRRLVDILRDESPVTRSAFTVLQKIWNRQQELGGSSVHMFVVRESLVNDPESKVTAERFDQARDAWELAMAVPFSGVTAMAQANGKFQSERAELPFESRESDDAQLIEQHRAAILNIVEAIRATDEELIHAIFLYLFVGMTMKQVGRQIGLSESRVSQLMTVLIPETVERAFKRTLPGFENNFSSAELSREARRALREFRKQTRQIWNFLPDEEQQEVLSAYFPKLAVALSSVC